MFYINIPPLLYSIYQSESEAEDSESEEINCKIIEALFKLSDSLLS